MTLAAAYVDVQSGHYPSGPLIAAGIVLAVSWSLALLATIRRDR